MTAVNVLTFAAKGSALTATEIDQNFLNLAANATTSSAGSLPALPLAPAGLFLAGDGTWKSPVDASAAVFSVNTKTGAVTLTASDVGAVASVNGKSGTSVTLTYSDVGACANNDARLTDSRNPLSHASTHRVSGSDPLALDTLAPATDNTSLNATTTAHGLLPKLTGNSAQFLAGDGLWRVPAGGGGGGDVSSVNGKTGAVVLVLPDFGVDALPSNSSLFLSGDGTWRAPSGSASVTSVNSRTGAVTLSATDVGLQALNSSTTQFYSGDGNLRTPAYPVTSVNTRTGDVVLTYADVGAASTSDTRLSNATSGHAGLHAQLSGTAGEYWDGSGNWRAERYDICAHYGFRPVASVPFFKMKAGRPFRIYSQANAAHQGMAEVAATASATFTLTKNGVSFGTATFAAAGTVPTFTVASDTDFAVGDILRIMPPGTQDATLSGVCITLNGRVL